MTRSPVAEARWQQARGVDLNAQGRPARALAALRRALAALDRASADEPGLRGRIWLSAALSEGELHGAAEAAAALERAGALAAAADDAELAALVGAQRAAIRMRAGDFAAAEAAFDSALAAQDALGDYDRCKLLVNRGALALFSGDLPAARLYLPRAIAIARRTGLTLEALQATHNLAYVLFLSGDLPAALQGMDEALALLPDLDSGIPLLDRARVLAEAGLTSAANRSLAAAAATFRRDRLTQELAETELEMARCALIGDDVEAARRYAMRARARFRRRGNDRWRRSAELVLLQGDLAAGRPGRRLTGPALRLRAEFERDGVRLPAQTAALIAAEAYLSAGAVDAAGQVLDRAGRAAARDPVTSRLHASFVRARFEVAAGRPGRAARRVRTGLAELAAYQARFGSIDLATAAAVHGRRLAELDLELALESGRPQAVLDAAERGRAVTNRLQPVRPPEDAQIAAWLAELRQIVESARATEPGSAALAPLLQQRRQLEARIATRGWARAGGGIVGTIVDWDALAAALADTTLVSFARVNGRLHAVVLDRGRSRLVELGPAAEVDEQVRRVRADLDVLASPRLAGPLAGSVTASLWRSLARLDAELLAPLHVTGAVVVVSTGILVQLPWGLLPSLCGVPVVVAPSATAWHAAHTRPSTRHREVVALSGPGLARAAAEAAAVARIWAGRVVEGGGAEFVSALADARIVHVAAHGVHEPESPLFSSLRLADGPLFAHELDQSARTPEHVVLSACELGLATVRPGDEALGLTSVFLHLGTRSVIGGVARVGDDLAARTMADYHARLRAGADSAVALADALAAAVENQAAPPFVCFGAAFSAT